MIISAPPSVVVRARYSGNNAEGISGRFDFAARLQSSRVNRFPRNFSSETQKRFHGSF